MPELPEVETVVRILNPFLQGKKILSVRVFRDKNILSGAKEFISSLAGETFLNVTRKGKYILFHLTNEKVIVSHLRMEGKYFEGKAKEAPQKHDLLIYDFDDGTSLRYNDVRKFGTIELKTEKDLFSTPPLNQIGPEPFEIKSNDFYLGLKKRKNKPIKEVLLDQSLIAGIGNIYDCEILYRAKIDPRLKAGLLSKPQAETILKEAREVLKEAIEQGGSTIKSYHPKEGVSGRMQNSLQAYGRQGEPCPRCHAPLRKISLGGRGTVYCPVCQHSSRPFVIGVSGPIASGKSSVTSYLKEKGYHILDADHLAHQSYQDPKIQETLRKEFGDEIFRSGRIDRKKLLSLVAENKEKRLLLNRLIHPYVFQKTQEAIDRGKYKKIVVDMPLLIGSPIENECDLILAVIAEEETRKQRLQKRGVDVEKSLALNRDFPLGALKKAAGIILDGSGDLANLRKQLDSYPFL